MDQANLYYEDTISRLNKKEKTLSEEKDTNNLLDIISDGITERNNLIKENHQLFESFIKSMVTTIERRDKATSGHSIRVAKYMVEFCKGINSWNMGKYKDLYFDETSIMEMYYAGLLHDIGKIGVREEILLKKSKLTKIELEAIKYRLYFNKSKLLLKGSVDSLNENEAKLIGKTDEIYFFIERINLKVYLSTEDLKNIEALEEYTFEDVDGSEKKLFKDKEIEKLKIKRGNLTYLERAEIEKHSEYTYEILKDIEWGADLKRVPQITSGHHEKLNGSGYPKGLKGGQINLETRILSIVDIFEALTAIDRPYKKPVSKERAIEILQEEARGNALDAELVEIFIQKEVFAKV
jgi:HD-GYP domain-containing protein (c-di-GMP phosphodiesterase class II)